MIKNNKISKVEQAKNLLYLFKGFVFSNSSGLPFLFLFLNSISYAIFCVYLCNKTESKFITILDIAIRQICDIGLLGLLILLCINYNWKRITWLAYICLCLIWVVNTIFQFILPLTKDYDTNANYFCVCMMLIYICFLSVSVYRLCNRN